MSEEFDVIVVGGGNAGFCAAHAARERGASVLMVEKADREWAGGNSFFTAGAFRTTFASRDELLELIDDPDDPRLEVTDVDAYRPEDFRADMLRITDGRCDPDLTETLVNDAGSTLSWLRDHGLRFALAYERQAFEVDGRYQFWGNLVVVTVDGGKGLISDHLAAAQSAGVEIRYGCPVERLLRDGSGAVTGVVSRGQAIHARAVIIAAGGFEADARHRAAFLGPQWELARVRGTPHNTGAALMAALDVGAQPAGNWSGCHSVAWDAAAPRFGNRHLTHRYTKQSYPFSLVVNAKGRRFLDEGADFRNYTYAKYGAEILRQPNGIAFQLFDARTRPLLRVNEYEAPGVSRHEASTIRELAQAIGVDPDALEQTVSEFNAAVQSGRFDPGVKDGKGTVGIDPPKSNWALPLDSPPYLAFEVCCGITFTFGGLRIAPTGQVLDGSDEPIPGLYASGETVGGLFYGNYPGGSGLTAGAVFGRHAGHHAADYCRSAPPGAAVAEGVNP